MLLCFSRPVDHHADRRCEWREVRGLLGAAACEEEVVVARASGRFGCAFAEPGSEEVVFGEPRNNSDALPGGAGGQMGGFGVRELETLPPLVVCRRAARRRRDPLEPQMAGRAISEFCGREAALRLEPSEAEFEELFAVCGTLSPSAVARAFGEELSWADGRTEWLPRYRALCAIDRLSRQGRWGQEVARKTVHRSASLLEHLLQEVPECREKAAVVLGRALDPAALETPAAL
mmetsp:Transcript_5748/g.15834  ORF Transcript_5748/g.15834 Transcript_5748/m.15834 type:complete len:233 (+) Transcript_5748:120-818(+)